MVEMAGAEHQQQAATAAQAVVVELAIQQLNTLVVQVHQDKVTRAVTADITHW
jgi:hypothetical protein